MVAARVKVPTSTTRAKARIAANWSIFFSNPKPASCHFATIVQYKKQCGRK
jgi:hypothetical protein